MLPLLRLIFNATALGLAAALTCALGLSALGAQDPAWTQLALGRLLAEAGRLPDAENLLFGLAAPYDASSWAWDWCAHQLNAGLGIKALRVADALWLVLATAALLGAAFRRGARPFGTAIFTALAVVAALPDLSPGPGLAAWSLFCIALWAMEGEFWSAFFNRWIWLPPAAALAVNLHPAAWALVPLVLLWLASEGSPRDPGAAPQPRLAKLLFTVALVACLCLHPQGPRPLLGIFGSLAPPPWLPQAYEPRQGALLFLAVTLVLWAASAWTQASASRRRDGLLLAVFGAAALISRDALPWALGLAAPMAAFRFDALVDALPAALRRLRWPLKLLLLPALALGLGRQALFSAAPPAELPRQTLDFYERELLDARILAPKAWAGWLEFKLAPHARLATDGRGRLSRDAEAQVQGLLEAREGWAAALQESGAEACWLPRGSPLALALARAQDWQPLSFDNASVLYLRVWEPTRDLVRVHAPRGLRPGDPGQCFEPSRLPQAEADLEAALARDPKLGVTYLYLAELWLAKRSEARARQTLEAGIQADPGFAELYARLVQLRAKRGDKEGARKAYIHALRRKAVPAWAAALEAL